MTLSPQQVHMLKMFSKGWRFKLFNNVRGSWNTYWSLRRRGLIKSVSEKDVMTEKGLEVLRGLK